MSKNLNITRAEAQKRAEVVSNTAYTVALTIDGKGETYSCVASITFAGIPTRFRDVPGLI